MPNGNNWRLLLRIAGLPYEERPQETSAQTFLQKILKRHGITKEMIDEYLGDDPQDRWSSMLDTMPKAIGFGKIVKRLLITHAPEVSSLFLKGASAPGPKLMAEDVAFLQTLYHELGIREEAARRARYESIYLHDKLKPHQLCVFMQTGAELTTRQVAEGLTWDLDKYQTPNDVANKILYPQRAVSKSMVWPFVRVIRAALDKGVKEGWIDVWSKRPYNAEMILIDKLKGRGLDDAWWERREHINKKDRDYAALEHCVQQTGITLTAIGPLIGEGPTWWAELTNERLSPSAVARVADAIAPYIQGKQTWEGRVEVTNPAWLENNRKIKEYVLSQMKNRLGDSAGLVEKLLGSKHDLTLGPTLEHLRKAVGLSLAATGKNKVLSQIERNIFDPNAVDEDATPTGALKDNLDIYIEKVTAAMRMFGKRPGTDIDNASARHVTNKRDKQHE